MAGSLIAATYARDLTPLSVGGQPVAQAWAQVDAYLRRARGPAHAALFAEPNFDPETGRTDWYAGPDGTARALDALDPAARDAALSSLDALRRDIEAEAAGLAASNRAGDAALGELLRAAMRIPDVSFVRVVGTQPVLFGWGHEQGGRSVTPEALVRLVAAPAPPAPPPPPPPMPVPPAVVAAEATAPSPWRWILAGLLGLLLLLVLLLLLLDPFGWFRVPPIQCLIPRDETALLDEARALQRTEEALRNELARIRQEIGARRLACPPPPAPPRPQPPPPRTEAPPPRPPQPPPPNEDVRRAVREQARSGRMQIILAWDDTNDLDLSVRCPNGQTIAFDSRQGCGGVLDVDRNSPDQPRTRTPVENIAWTAEPPPGRYTVYVTHYARQGGPASSDYRVTIRMTGQPDRTYTGSVAAGQRATVTSFDWPPAGGR